MLQLRGLLKKDWKIIKTYVFLALALDLVIPFSIAFLYPTEFTVGLIVIIGTIMALHILLPLLFLAIMFTKDLDRPDIFFHSTASIHKINASKFVVAFLGAIASFLWISLIGIMAALLSSEVFNIQELIPMGGYFSISIIFIAIESTIVFYFFLTLFFTMKTKIGAFAYIVTFGLFFFFIDLWSRLQETDFFQRITDFWVISLNDSKLLSDFSANIGSTAFSDDGDLTLSLGKFFVLGILLVFLYLLSAYWFEKKVRV